MMFRSLASLTVKHCRGELEEGVAATQLGHTDTVSGRGRCGCVLREGVVLEDDARLGEVRCQLLHVRLCLFAMRALEVSELDNLKVLRCRTFVRTVGLLLQDGTIFRVGMIAEGNDLVPRDDVLLVLQDKKPNAGRLRFSGLVGHVDGNPADPFYRGLLDGPDFKDAVFVVSPTVLEKRLDGFFAGRGCRKVGR